MANEKKQAIIYGLVNDVLVELMAKTNIENVVYSVGSDGTEVYLSTKLAEIIANIDTKASTEAMNAAISAAIDGLIDGAPGTYDTLKEIADYIAAHEDVVTALNEAIGNKADKTAVEELSAALTALTTTVNGKADKATTLAGYGITDAYTKTETENKIAAAVENATGGESAASVKSALDAYKTENDAAVAALEEKAHEHENKEELDKIATGDKAKWDKAVTDLSDEITRAKAAEEANAAAAAAAKSAADAAQADVDVLVGDDADKSARQIAAEETAKIVAGADTAYDTLKEIADWISTHGSDAATMQSNIVALQNQLSGIAAGNGTVKKYVDDAIAALNVGQYALAADLTALAARVTTVEGKVSTLEGQAHTHANKAVLDGITAAQVSEWDSKGTVYVQADQPAALAAGDLWIKIAE